MRVTSKPSSTAMAVLQPFSMAVNTAAPPSVSLSRRATMRQTCRPCRRMLRNSKSRPLDSCGGGGGMIVLPINHGEIGGVKDQHEQRETQAERQILAEGDLVRLLE